MIATILALGTGLLVSGCGGGEDDDGSGSTQAGGGSGETVRMVMSWLPEAEQGGFWQIEAADLSGKDGGPTVDTMPGGPQIATIPQVASGQYDYGMADADEVLQARAEGVPVVAIFRTFDTNPRCLMFQPEANIDSIEDIAGHPVAIATGSGFWVYLKKKYDLDVEEQNYTGTLSQLKQNPQLVQQCYYTGEPREAEEAGIPHEELLVAESGYNPYAAVIFTTEQKIAEDPEEVRAVIGYAATGWEQFMEDPAVAIDYIAGLNEETSREELEYTYDRMQELIRGQIGCMEESRWTELADQLRSVDLLGDTDPREAYTNEFVPADCA